MRLNNNVQDDDVESLLSSSFVFSAIGGSMRVASSSISGFFQFGVLSGLILTFFIFVWDDISFDRC